MKLKMGAHAFLRDYWQSAPLLIRQALPSYASPLSPNDLAALACEPDMQSRLVLKRGRQWLVEHGPFDAVRFAKLPEKDWTLLVQGVDRRDPAVHALLKHFDFLPRWRVDDIMISYAVPGGSVGAHVDQYDVFLLQVAGTRRWQIDASTNPDCSFQAKPALKLLKHFKPTHDWLLGPGDMLYLPPGVPHHGVSQDSECLSFSIGFRAPSAQELLQAYASGLPEELRYSDAGLSATTYPRVLDDAAIARGKALLHAAIDAPAGNFQEFFAGYLSAYRSTQLADLRPARASVAVLRTRLAAGAQITVAPGVRWLLSANQRDLYVAGSRFSCPNACVAALSGDQPFAVTGMDCAAQDFIVAGLKRGWLHFYAADS